MLNRRDKAIIILTLLIAVSYPYVLSQTPPAPNTLEHDEGLNIPTLTADEYYLGTAAPTIITDRLEGNYNDTGLSTPWLQLSGENRTSWPVDGPDYVVTTDGTGTYSSFDTGSGQITTSSNATTIIQGAITVANSTSRGGVYDGGSVYITAGRYNLSGSLTMGDYVNIYGDGHYLTELYMTVSGKPMFRSPDPAGTSPAVHCNLRDLWLFGANQAGSTGMELVINRCMMTRVKVSHFETGIRFYGVGTVWMTQRTYEVDIVNCIITNNAEAQIRWDEYSSDCLVDDTIIYGTAGGGSTAIGAWHRTGGGGTLYSQVHFNELQYDLVVNSGGGPALDNCYFDGDDSNKNQILIEPSLGAIGNIRISGSRFLTGTSSGSYATILLNATDNQIGRVIISDNFFTPQGSYDTPQYIYQELIGANITRGVFKDNTIIPGAWNATLSTNPVSIDTDCSTGFNSIQAPLIQGIAFGVDVGEPWGWNISSSNDYATTFTQLPHELTRIVQVKIYGVSWVAETDSMTLEVQIYGGADNEVYTTETITIGTLNSTSADFDAGDVIFWTVKGTDDVDLDHLYGGDSVSFRFIYESASGGSCATNSRLRNVIVEYVP